MIRVGIIGSTGYAGAELVKILSVHPNVKLTTVTSRQYAGIAFSDVYPSLKGVTELICEEFNIEKFCEEVDCAFIALPHKLPMAIVPRLLDMGKKVIDLSADFRFDEPSLYESYYQSHSEPELLKQAVYGLSEIYTEQIKTASLIGNPGCYPTTVLLALIPLIKSGLIDTTHIIADSKSGVSGAGRSLSLATHFCEANEAFRAYKLDGHRHRPEMEEVLSKEAGKPVSITFVPHLLPAIRGMLSTLYVTANEKTRSDDIRNCLESFYNGRHFVRVYSDCTNPPDIKYVQNSNFCDIGFHLDESSKKLVIISAIDNLVKGASGQAVQNMNLMFGFDEASGLR